MAVNASVCNFGWKAADFDLEGTDGRRHGLADIRGERATLVMFICNHCPYVKAVIDDIIADVNALKPEGVGAIAIMSNDTDGYPEDSFANMKRWAERKGFPFPYVIDVGQDVARAYDAVCTPDFFGFNRDLELQYRGRIREVRGTQPVPASRRELLEAMIEIAASGQGPRAQSPSMGCSIKWRH